MNIKIIPPSPTAPNIREIHPNFLNQYCEPMLQTLPLIEQGELMIQMADNYCQRVIEHYNNQNMQDARENWEKAVELYEKILVQTKSTYEIKSLLESYLISTCGNYIVQENADPELSDKLINTIEITRNTFANYETLIINHNEARNFTENFHKEIEKTETKVINSANKSNLSTMRLYYNILVFIQLFGQLALMTGLAGGSINTVDFWGGLIKDLYEINFYKELKANYEQIKDDAYRKIVNP